MRRKVIRVIFSVIFSVISAGPRFVEIQKPWQPRQRDVTTSPLLNPLSPNSDQPQISPCNISAL